MANIVNNSSIDINLLDSECVYNNNYNYYKKSIDLWKSNDMDLKKYLLEREIFLIHNLVNLYHKVMNGIYGGIMIKIGTNIDDIRRLKDFMRYIFPIGKIDNMINRIENNQLYDDQMETLERILYVYIYEHLIETYCLEKENIDYEDQNELMKMLISVSTIKRLTLEDIVNISIIYLETKDNNNMNGINGKLSYSLFKNYFQYDIILEEYLDNDIYDMEYEEVDDMRVSVNNQVLYPVFMQSSLMNNYMDLRNQTNMSYSQKSTDSIMNTFMEKHNQFMENARKINDMIFTK